MPSGSIKKRRLDSGPTRYDVVVDLGSDSDGRRRQRSKTYRTKKEAQAALSAWRYEIDQGRAVDRNAQTVADLVTFWLGSHGAHNLRPKTLEGYRALLQKHLVPALGAVPAQKLTAARVQHCYHALGAAGAGTRSIGLCHQLLCQILDQAVKMGALVRNVARDAQPPRHHPQAMQTWSREDGRAFLSLARRHRYAPLWDLALCTGLRRGELLGLRWDDIDGGALHVRQAQVALYTPGAGYTVVYGPPKTKAALRTIPLPAPVLEALAAHRAQQAEARLAAKAWPAPDLVFTTQDGRPLLPQALIKEHVKLCHAAGVKRIRLHDLRHTCATLALEAGMPIRELSEMLGHSKTSTTMNVYAHATQRGRDKFAPIMSEVLYGA